MNSQTKLQEPIGKFLLSFCHVITDMINKIKMKWQKEFVCCSNDHTKTVGPKFLGTKIIAKFKKKIDFTNFLHIVVVFLIRRELLCQIGNKKTIQDILFWFYFCKFFLFLIVNRSHHVFKFKIEVQIDFARFKLLPIFFNFFDHFFFVHFFRIF